MHMSRHIGSLACAVLAVVACDACVAAENDANEIFVRRILPVARAGKASGCCECHVAGGDLAQYIRDDAAATFAALRAAGLVNAEQPEKSKLLEFIARAPEKGDPVLAKVRAEELAAFRTWIAAAAKDPRLVGQKFVSAESTRPIGPSLPPEVIRHARRDRVLASFVGTLRIERERRARRQSPGRNSGRAASDR